MKEIQGAAKLKPVSEGISFSKKFIGISKSTKSMFNHMDWCILWLQKLRVD